MLKKYLAIIAVVTIFNSLYAQGNWELMVPTPTSNQMVSLHFIDAWTGWSVGEYGTILKTGDGGNTWRIIEIPWLTDLTDVFFADAQTGYAVGKDGLVLKSTDGGESWTRQTIRYSNNLSRVRFRDRGQGWIIGEKGLILHTVDGGSTWQQQITNCRDDLLGVAFVGAQAICAVGANNMILISTDGSTWQRIGLDSNSVFLLQDVYFLNEIYGWIGGSDARDEGVLFKTKDGGKHWQQQKIIGSEFKTPDVRSSGSGLDGKGVQQIYFASDLLTGVCLVGTRFGHWTGGNFPLFTNDGGLNWQVEIMEASPVNFQKGRFCFLTDTRVISTGFQGDFHFSDDAGRSWYLPDWDKRRWDELVIGNNGNLLLLQNYPNYYRSWDGGKSWKPIIPTFLDSLGHPVSRAEGICSISFINGADTLWALAC